MDHGDNLPAITTEESKKLSSPEEYPEGGFSAWATAFGG